VSAEIRTGDLSITNQKSYGLTQLALPENTEKESGGDGMLIFLYIHQPFH
jgi:hypothetical protein